MKTHRGFWWLPGDEKRHLAGTLTYGEHEQIRLELDLPNPTAQNSSLHKWIQADEEHGRHERLIVHGSSHDRKLFTLFNGFVRRPSMSSPGSAELLFNSGIKGWLFDEPQDVPVTRIVARFHGLVAWLGHNPFKPEYDDDIQVVKITHTLPAPMAFPIDDNRKLALKWDRSGPNNSIVQTEMSVRSFPFIGIEYTDPCPLKEAQSDLGIIGNLLTLLLGAPTTSHETTFNSPDALERIGEKTYPTKLRPLGSRFKLKDTLNDWTPLDVLLPFEEVAELFGRIVQKWFELHKKCWPAFVSYLASLRTPMPFAEDRLFAASSAAEAFHRCLVTLEPPIPDAEWCLIRETMLREVPKSRREFLKSRIGGINTVSYKARLRGLIERFPTLTADVIGDQTSQEQFCRVVTDLRNVEAHKLDRSNVPRDGGTLVRIADKLKVILNAWLLAECGIPGERIETAIRRNTRCWYYASNETWKWNESL